MTKLRPLVFFSLAIILLGGVATPAISPNLLRAAFADQPATPTNFTATPVSTTQINLSWSSTTIGHNNHHTDIYRCTGASCNPTTLIATTGKGVTSYPDTGLSAATTYGYKIVEVHGGNTASAGSVYATTNSPPVASITLIKVVINDNGGTAGPNDFGLTVEGNPVSSGATTTVNANTPIAINEAVLAGYSFVSITGTGCPANLGGTVTLSSGQSITCTITNNDIAPQLVVIKHLTNDNGGTASAADFTLSVSGNNPTPASFAGSEAGTTVTLNAGSYGVGESEPAGYSLSSSADCSGTISIGQTKTCTITNNDQAATLTVIKNVINDNTGTSAASEFTINVSGTNASPDSFAGDEAGTTVSLDAGAYSVSEPELEGYASSLSDDCSGTIAHGETKTCTITNDDNPVGAGGVPVPVGGDSPGAAPSVSSFTVNTANQAGFAAILELDPNKVHTNVIETYDPSTVRIRLSNDAGSYLIEHVGLYINLNGIFREVGNSDTYIIWEKNKPLQVADPHGYLSDVDAKTVVIGRNLQLTLSFTFTKPMPKGDVILRMWDFYRNSRDLHYTDGLEVVKPMTISPGSQIPIWVKDNAKFWAQGTIEDSEFIRGIQYLVDNGIIKMPAKAGQISAAQMPSWVKNSAKWWSEDKISEKDFVGGIQYLIASGILVT